MKKEKIGTLLVLFSMLTSQSFSQVQEKRLNGFEEKFEREVSNIRDVKFIDESSIAVISARKLSIIDGEGDEIATHTSEYPIDFFTSENSTEVVLVENIYPENWRVSIFDNSGNKAPVLEGPQFEKIIFTETLDFFATVIDKCQVYGKDGSLLETVTTNESHLSGFLGSELYVVESVLQSSASKGRLDEISRQISQLEQDQQKELEELKNEISAQKEKNQSMEELEEKRKEIIGKYRRELYQYRAQQALELNNRVQQKTFLKRYDPKTGEINEFELEIDSDYRIQDSNARFNESLILSKNTGLAAFRVLSVSGYGQKLILVDVAEGRVVAEFQYKIIHQYRMQDDEIYVYGSGSEGGNKITIINLETASRIFESETIPTALPWEFKSIDKNEDELILLSAKDVHTFREVRLSLTDGSVLELNSRRAGSTENQDREILLSSQTSNRRILLKPNTQAGSSLKLFNRKN
ncbi:MAG: hypothetical protein WD361_13950 [Gracilimonas sp.]